MGMANGVYFEKYNNHHSSLSQEQVHKWTLVSSQNVGCGSDKEECITII